MKKWCETHNSEQAYHQSDSKYCQALYYDATEGECELVDMDARWAVKLLIHRLREWDD